MSDILLCLYTTILSLQRVATMSMKSCAGVLAGAAVVVAAAAGEKSSGSGSGMHFLAIGDWGKKQSERVSEWK